MTQFVSQLSKTMGQSFKAEMFRLSLEKKAKPLVNSLAVAHRIGVQTIRIDLLKTTWRFGLLLGKTAKKKTLLQNHLLAV